MKKFILFAPLLLCILFVKISNAQTIVFHEDFEVPDSMSSTGVPTWFPDANYQTNGSYCYRDTVAQNGTGYLTSTTFSTTGNFFVLLSFDQICKISFADQAYIEVSNDDGNTWVILDASHYLGASIYFPIYHYFASFSYGPTGWDAAHDAALPSNTWWRTELFDISSVAANSSQVKIRFRITDGNGNGNSGNYGWLIDQVKVQAAPHELVPPVIRWSPPVLQGTVYNTGPFIISDTITDASVIASATLYYSINNGASVAVPMNHSGNIYHGTIPSVNVGDTVCYYVQASDVWANATVLPAVGCQRFTTTLGISFPYHDNFDVNTLWTDSTISGSSWQLGMPAFGLTTGAHSAPNAWDVSLASAYLSNTRTYLISPIFNFIGVFNAELSFWRNNNSEASWDGVRVECTTNGNTWWQLGRLGDPRGTNWYNSTNLNSNPGPAFSGSSGGVWIQSKYKLDTLNNTAGPVRIRFVFTSDQTQNRDGFSIDDFSIVQPSAHDVGVTAILRPGSGTTANTVDSIRVVIRNFGSDTTSHFPVAYRINSGSTVTVVYPGVLQPSASDTLTFATHYTVPQGAFTVCAWTAAGNDGNPLNDTLCKNAGGLNLYPIPYTDHFDTGIAVWFNYSLNAGNNWQQGTPAFGQTTGAHSPNTCWDINLTSTYLNYALSYLSSPLFDFAGITNARLSFWQNRNTEANFDGVRLEYSINGDTSWLVLGVFNDPNAINWYTDASIYSSFLPAWDGISMSTTGTAGWQQSTYLNLPSAMYGHTVQFRFVFSSDASITRDGFSIDDFEIVVLPVGITTVDAVSGHLRMYPNPTDGFFYLRNDEWKNESSTIAVTDILGNEVWNGTFTKSGSAVVDLSRQPNGIYLLRVAAGSEIVSERIVLCK